MPLSIPRDANGEATHRGDDVACVAYVACGVAYEAGYETNHGGEDDDDDDVVDGDVNPRNNIVDNILPAIGKVIIIPTK